MTWIYPGDSPVVTARRVAWAYRQRLHQLAPADCDQLDTIMRNLGQHWAAPQPLPADPDTWIGTAAAARLAAVAPATIGYLRRAGRLTGRRKSAGRWEYQIGDILALATQPRTRQTRETTPATKRES